MTNEQKFFGELTEYGRKCITTLHGVDVFTGEPQKCRDMNCGNCLLQGQGDCNKSFRQWLKQEYKEPVKLTEFEREVLKRAKKQGHRYVVRDFERHIEFYEYKPIRKGRFWDISVSSVWNDYDELLDNDFQFIQWEDEPYNIEELLKGE